MWFQSGGKAKFLPHWNLNNRSTLFSKQSEINPAVKEKLRKYAACLTEDTKHNNMDFSVFYRMDHFCEERLWIRSHIQVFQLKPYGHPSHFNFFIYNKRGSKRSPPPHKVLTGYRRTLKFLDKHELMYSQARSESCSGTPFWGRCCVLTPDNRGCSATSASKLTTVSRPLASAETAYMMVSLQGKRGSAPGSHIPEHSVNVIQDTIDKEVTMHQVLWKGNSTDFCYPARFTFGTS